MIKATPLRVELSTDYLFNTDQVAIKTVQRIDGAVQGRSERVSFRSAQLCRSLRVARKRKRDGLVTSFETMQAMELGGCRTGDLRGVASVRHVQDGLAHRSGCQ